MIKKASCLLNGSEYIDELYELFLKNSDSVSLEWQKYFRELDQGLDASKLISHEAIRENFKNIKNTGAVNVVNSSDTQSTLIHAYRELGHFEANLDPLKLGAKITLPELHSTDPSLQSIIAKYRKIYCESIGAEFCHITNQDEVHWLENKLENNNGLNLSSAQKKHILNCLIASDGLEKYLGSKYVGQTRFSLEGGDSLIPLLDNLIQYSSEKKVKEIVIGMAHRGRLNVLVNILGKSPQELFDEFDGKINTHGRTGDVKYHLGFSSDIKTDKEPVHVSLGFNPSHLEIISPVTIGSVRARQKRQGLDQRENILGIQIHGDAAFAGQGVVMETFALSQTDGFGTGGTIHIIINNQVGFTTDPKNARSTFYCTDIAKMVQAPIFHVNGDDPEAVLFVGQLALDYRMKYAKDVVIDLISYRRHGHNEGDEPSATQPIMYQKIKSHLTVREVYANTLLTQKIMTQDEINARVLNYRDDLDAGKNSLPQIISQGINPHGEDWTPYLNKSFDIHAKTNVDIQVLKKLGAQINQIPTGMVLQPQVAKMISDNQKMAQGEIPMNWGFAENLAYATLLNDNYNIRLTGQDCGRGTFAHRHAVLHDYNNGNTYVPLQNLIAQNKNQKNYFSIFDSILSEVAVLGFEYGYSSTSPSTLVIWEAQYGDFANGAQVVIDQFVSSGEQKWGRLSGLVMLLPHAQEGKGPEHSSARLERYLQLCAQDNMQVCIPTTPAQIFHLLRRQMIRPVRKPLIVLSPKGLLRHKLAVSSLEELSQGEFQTVIKDIDNTKPELITRVIFCSGKIYYELLDARRAEKLDNVAIVRVEELYPFPEKEIKKILAYYKKADDFIWCQDEPENQGAWFYVARYFNSFRYVGSYEMAAPALGSSKTYTKAQKEIIIHALKGNPT